MERLHMNHLRDLIRRLRSGESERRIARDLNISRPTVHKYREMAEAHGFLQPGSRVPDEASLLAPWGRALNRRAYLPVLSRTGTLCSAWLINR